MELKTEASVFFRRDGGLYHQLPKEIYDGKTQNIPKKPFSADWNTFRRVESANNSRNESALLREKQLCEIPTRINAWSFQTNQDKDFERERTCIRTNWTWFCSVWIKEDELLESTHAQNHPINMINRVPAQSFVDQCKKGWFWGMKRRARPFWHFRSLNSS